MKLTWEINAEKSTLTSWFSQVVHMVGGSVSSICSLCDQEPEDITHLLACCKSLDHARRDDVEQLQQIYESEGIPPPRSPSEITSAVLNGTMYSPDRVYKVNSTDQLEYKGGRV